MLFYFLLSLFGFGLYRDGAPCMVHTYIDTGLWEHQQGALFFFSGMMLGISSFVFISFNIVSAIYLHMDLACLLSVYLEFDMAGVVNC